MSAGQCAHSQLAIAAELLRIHKRLSAYASVYEVVCPMDGETRRNTRLAATIHTLRTQYEWNIVTQQAPGELAEYVLYAAGRYPASLTAPVAPGAIDDTPPPPELVCATCGEPVDRKRIRETLVGGWAKGSCPSRECVSHDIGDKLAIFKPPRGVR